MKGTIARVTDRGFGFITPEDGSKDVFFHANAVVERGFDTLREGDAVTFDLEEGPKGPSAQNVTPAGAADAAPATEETPSEEAPAADSE